MVCLSFCLLLLYFDESCCYSLMTLMALTTIMTMTILMTRISCSPGALEVARLLTIARVRGSIPAGSTIYHQKNPL